MGREWYLGGKSSKSKRSATSGRIVDTATTGCMCAVFQLFDFQFASNFQHQNQPQPCILTPFHEETNNIPKGSEAPRNSLKSEEGTSLSSIIEDESESIQSLNNIQMGINHIKTSQASSHPRSNDQIGSDTSNNSPGTKTPTLVARLMGLDLLPDHPSSQSARVQKKSRSRLLAAEKGSSGGTRSLPETPRISAARRSDVDNNNNHNQHHHHRLSLQINKENNIHNPGDDFDFSRLYSLKTAKQGRSSSEWQSENSSAKSPGYYARQIVKQVKESVTRRVGSDITNTVKTRSDHQQQYNYNTNRRDSDLVNRTKLPTKIRSPKLDETPVPISKTEQKVTSSERVEEKGEGKGKRKGIRQKIMQEEAFVFGSATSQRGGKGNYSVTQYEKSKSKKTPLSNDLINLNVVPITLLALKKNPGNDVQASRHQQFVVKQESGTVSAEEAGQESKLRKPTSHSSCSQSHKKYNSSHVPNPPRTYQTTDHVINHTADPHSSLRRYISRILGRTGVSPSSHVSFTNWFSPSHPLDPSIFHRLEIYYSTYFINHTNPNSHDQLLSLRCNRRLVFDVVDEVLVGILKPFINLKPWINSSGYNNQISINSVSDCCNNNNNVVIRSKSKGGCMKGSDLIEALCSRVEGFPCKDCQVLEDIDALIDNDLRENDHRSLKGVKEMAFEDEGEALVTEIEKDLVDTLVHEMALILVPNNWN